MAVVLLRYRVETLAPSSGAHPSPAFYKLSGSAGVCPEGSVCPGGLAAPLALPGYFAWHENGKYEVHRCAGPNATERCLGFTSGDRSRDGNAWGQCGYRYRDFMCDGCGRRFDYEDPGEGYFRSNQNSCEKCPTTDPVLIVMMLATVVVLVLFLCFFVAVRLAKINVKAFAPFTIATDYYQMLAIMPLLQLGWPEQHEGMKRLRFHPELNHL